MAGSRRKPRGPCARSGRCLLALLTSGVLALLACGADEPEPPATSEPESPTVVEEPEPVEEEPEPIEEEPADDVSAADGEPELLWSVTHENPISALAMSPDGTHLVAAEWATYLHQLADGLLVDVFAHRHTPGDLAFSPGGETVAAGMGLFGVALVDVVQGEELREVGSGYDSRVAYHPEGNQLATAGREGTVWLWDADGTEQVAALEAPATDMLTALEYHPRGDLLAATDAACVVRLWDLANQEVQHELEVDTGDGSCLLARPFAFSPDGNLMVGAVREDFDPFLRFWNVEDTGLVLEIPAPARIGELAFSPDGQLLAIMSRDPMSGPATTIIEVESGATRYVLDQTFDPAVSSWPNTGAFSPDGGHLAVGRFDGTIEVWRLPGAQELVAPEREPCEPLPIPGDVLFDTGSAGLRPDAGPVLEELAQQLREGFPEATLTFIGHTDSRGAADANLQLSNERASEVARWFEAWASDQDMDGWAIEVDGLGDTALAVPDTDHQDNFLSEAGALNRRVEIDITAETCGP